MTKAKAKKSSPEMRGAASRERFNRLYISLRNRICLLDYPPGMRLSEEALAAEFGVSRTPLRRVLGWLESQGLLESVQGVGTIVTDVDVQALGQVYQLRMELAELIGKLSPAIPNRQTLDLFRTLNTRAQALLKQPDGRVFAELNMDYFQALMRLTDNAPLREVSERLYNRTARIWLKLISNLDLAGEIAAFAREVADTLEAVEIGDLEAAGHICRSHISMSFMRLKKQGGLDRPL